VKNTRRMVIGLWIAAALIGFFGIAKTLDRTFIGLDTSAFLAGEWIQTALERAGVTLEFSLAGLFWSGVSLLAVALFTFFLVRGSVLEHGHVLLGRADGTPGHRTAVWARVDTGVGPVLVVCTHLAYRFDESALRALILTGARDKDAGVRREAVLAAQAFGHDDTAMPFVRALGSKNLRLAGYAAEAVADCSHRRIDRRAVEDIRDQADRLGAVVVRYFVDRPVDIRLGARADYDRRAFGCEHIGRGASHAPAAAGHDRDLAL